MGLKYLLSLDYDRVDLAFMNREMKRLNFRFPQTFFYIYKSSEDSYHLRCFEPMGLEQGMEILNFSRCSLDYKRFCRRVKKFPIREGKKIWFKEDGIVIKYKPVLI